MKERCFPPPPSSFIFFLLLKRIFDFQHITQRHVIHTCPLDLEDRTDGSEDAIGVPLRKVPNGVLVPQNVFQSTLARDRAKFKKKETTRKDRVYTWMKEHISSDKRKETPEKILYLASKHFEFLSSAHLISL